MILLHRPGPIIGLGRGTEHKLHSEPQEIKCSHQRKTEMDRNQPGTGDAGTQPGANADHQVRDGAGEVHRAAGH